MNEKNWDNENDFDDDFESFDDDFEGYNEDDLWDDDNDDGFEASSLYNQFLDKEYLNNMDNL